MTQHSCQIDDRGSSLLSYCPTRKSGSQRSHHCEPGSFRTFFISESFQGLSPKVSPKLNTLSPPKSPPRFWTSPPTFLESLFLLFSHSICMQIHLFNPDCLCIHCFVCHIALISSAITPQISSACTTVPSISRKPWSHPQY